MTVSNKQLSIAIIIAFFAGILVYFFFWFGYIEIFINHAEVENFTIKSREKTYKCTKNPCRIKVRAGSKFLAQVIHPLAAKKMITVLKVPLWETKKIEIPAKKELPEVKIKKLFKTAEQDALNKFLGGKKSDFKAFGPVLVAENNKFVIFSREIAGQLQVFIRNKNSEQLLTTIKDDFFPIILEKNFSLTPNGIIIPAKKRVYYYDFTTQRKSVLLEKNSLRLSSISVSSTGDEVIFYDLKEKKWQKLTSSGEIKNLGNLNFAGFWNDKSLEIQENKISLDGVESWEIPAKISASDKIYFRENHLIIEKDFEVWEIAL